MADATTPAALKHRITKAIEQTRITNPDKIEVTDTHIIASYTGAYDISLVSSLTSVLKENDINYLDPRPGTDDDFKIEVTTDGDGVKRDPVITLRRFTLDEYNAALDEMIAARTA